VESRSEISATPLLRDIAMDPQAIDAEDSLTLGDLAAATEHERATPSVGNTPVRKVGDPLLASSEDIPLLMDAIAVDPTPSIPTKGEGDIPEINSIIALPEQLNEAAATALSAHSSPSRLGFATETRPAAPSLSLVTKERSAPPSSPPATLAEIAIETVSRLSLAVEPDPLQNSEGTEVLDDAALLALLNAPTQPVSVSVAQTINDDMPPEVALQHLPDTIDAAPPDEPLEFTQAAPPADFNEPPTSSTSALIERLRLDEQETFERSLGTINLSEPKIAESNNPAPQLTATPGTPSMDAPMPNNPLGAAVANTLAGELQQQMYRKIDQLISETVDTLTRDLHAQLGSKIEAMVLAAIDETLPPLLEQFANGLNSNLRPKLQTKLPELLADVLGKPRH